MIYDFSNKIYKNIKKQNSNVCFMNDLKKLTNEINGLKMQISILKMHYLKKKLKLELIN